MHQLITGAAIVTRPTLSQLTQHLLLLSHAPLAEISVKRPVYNRMGKSPYAYTQAPVYPRVGSPAEPRSSQPPQQRLDLRERCLGMDRDVGVTHLHERGQVWTTLDELLVATATHLNQMPGNTAITAAGSGLCWKACPVSSCLQALDRALGLT